MESNSNYVGEGDPFDEVRISLRYGHPSGVVQAVHPETGTKQIGESAPEAVRELWSLLRAGQQLVPIHVATCPCGDYNTFDSERLAVEWGEDHEDTCEDRDGEEVHVSVVDP